MKLFRIFAGLLVMALLLTACQAAGSTTVAETSSPAKSYPAATQPAVAATGYPQPGQGQNVAPAGSGVQMVDGYPVLPGDENKAFGNFFIDSAELRPNTSNSSQTDLYVKGTLPTPCNEIRAYVNPPDANKQIAVRVYSVADKEKVCTQALQPFDGLATTFKDIPAGTYTVVANDIPVGELTIP